MPDLTAIQLALRSRLLTLSVCTTGTMSLAATTTGYTRLTGSFITDGFHPGMEVVPAGFGTNTPRLIKQVAALTLTTYETLTAEGSAGGRSLSVSLPAARAWENVAFERPSNLHPFAEEEFVPGPGFSPGLIPHGIEEDQGFYLVKLYGPENVGLQGITVPADAIRDLYPAGDSSLLTGLRIGANPQKPYRSALRPDGKGWSVVVVTIPWRFTSVN